MFDGLKLYFLIFPWVLGLCFEVENNEGLNVKHLNKHKDVIHADITALNTIKALEKISFFYFKHKKEASIDFAFGMRVAEGNINQIFIILAVISRTV